MLAVVLSIPCYMDDEGRSVRADGSPWEFISRVSKWGIPQ